METGYQFFISSWMVVYVMANQFTGVAVSNAVIAESMNIGHRKRQQLINQLNVGGGAVHQNKFLYISHL